MRVAIFLLEVIVSLIAAAIASAQVGVINHDQVQPFPEPEPANDAERAAVHFKPQLTIAYGCESYPAVDAAGSVSGGLKWAGFADGECTGSPLGSQVYSRSDWYRGKWAIMYAWYFPKARQGMGKRTAVGSRHNWLWAVIWIDDPASNTSTIEGVSMSARLGYQRRSPPQAKYVEGSSVKLGVYRGFWRGGKAALRLTEEGGETQDLIQWDQLTDEARKSLSSFDFDDSFWNLKKREMPLKDGVFQKKLKKSYPF